MATIVTLTPSTATVAPGGEAAVECRVRNTGSVVDQFTATVLGDAAAWATVEPPSISLFPGSDGSVRVTFSPTRSGDVPSGDVTYGVRVVSREDPAGATVEEGTITVLPFTLVTAELLPRISRGRRRTEVRVAVDNRGNTAVNAGVSASDMEETLAFDADPPGVVVQPGAAEFVRLQLRARKPFRKGPAQTHPYQVVLQVGDSVVAATDGTFVQVATRPPWLRRLVLLSLLGLFVLAALWFGLLRPTVQSTARRAAQEAVVPPTIGSGGGGAGAGGGGASDSGGGSGSGDADTGSGAGVAGAGQPIDGRLFLTADGSTSFEVPAGSALQLTDIVLQNPAGETGRLEIRRGDTALLVVELGNFRDLDYHFVAPIVFASGQKLTLFSDCTSPTCTPGAYFAGFLVKA